MSFTLCTQQEAINKAGTNTNSTIVASGTALGQWSDEAEGIFCSLANYDVVTNYGSLTGNGKQIATSFCTAYIATHIINYSMDNIGSRQAETRLDILENDMDRITTLIKDNRIKAYLNVSES